MAERVEKVSRWFGDNGNTTQSQASIVDLDVTPTRTTLRAVADGTTFTITFLSPIEVSFLSSWYEGPNTQLTRIIARKYGLAVDSAVVHRCRIFIDRVAVY